MSFIPPGEGFWTFDPTHFPRPLSKWMQENYGFEYGSNHARRTVRTRYYAVFVFNQVPFLHTMFYAFYLPGLPYQDNQLSLCTSVQLLST